MKYIKDIKAILLEIGMAFSVHGYMKSTGFFCLPQRKKETQKKEKRKSKKKTGKERKTKEIWSKKRSLKDTENYSQNTSLTNSDRLLEMILTPYTHHVKRFFLFRECCTVFPMAP